MINGVEKQYPEANQSVIQKAKYESLKNLNVATKIPKILKEKLKNKKINQIYKEFDRSLNISENFIVGVSGGPDSLALAFLAKIFSIKKNIKAKFFVVNHKLRPESTTEAKDIQKILKNIILIVKY